MRTKLLIYSFLLNFILLILACEKETNLPPGYSNAHNFLKEIGFQGNVLVRKGNTDILRESFGMANAQTSEPNMPDTEFRIGSMSKAFTVLGILKLKREGHITSFDQTINEFMEGFPFGDEITLNHLLTHSSGLPDHVVAFEEVLKNSSQQVTPQDMLESIAAAVQEDGLLFAPGSTHAYSNANYLLLGMLIEEVSGKLYHDYLAETLEVQGMQNTHKGDDVITEPKEARGYNKGAEVEAYPMKIAFGAGDWVSSIPDLERWAHAWLTDLLTEEEKSLVFAQPQSDEVTEFGMGWFTLKTQGKLTYFHGGDIDGFTSLLVLYPETNGMVIALSNKQNQRHQLDQMIEVFARYEF